MNFATFKERAEDLYDGIMEDPKKRVIFIAVCSFVIGLAIGRLA